MPDTNGGDPLQPDDHNAPQQNPASRGQDDSSQPRPKKRRRRRRRSRKKTTPSDAVLTSAPLSPEESLPVIEPSPEQLLSIETLPSESVSAEPENVSSNSFDHFLSVESAPPPFDKGSAFDETSADQPIPETASAPLSSDQTQAEESILDQPIPEQPLPPTHPVPETPAPDLSPTFDSPVQEETSPPLFQEETSPPSFSEPEPVISEPSQEFEPIFPPSEPENFEPEQPNVSNVPEEPTPLHEVFEKIKSLADGGLIKNCFLIVFVGIVIYLFYSFHLYQAFYSTVYQWLHPPKPTPVEVQIREEDLDQWGINGTFLFGHNQGSEADILEPALKNAFYFGKLAEPHVEGETGITPAYYYGLLQDQAYQTNQFIKYVQYLRTLQDLYEIDVYAMLDQTTERDKKLLGYLDQLKAAYDQSITYSHELGLLVDDLKVSDDSLASDRSTYENDFFVALQSLAPEKADFLLKSFIDINQKHVALRARLSALQKILEYYQTALGRLNIRIQAVDKNRDALIQGIHVIDVPGANLDIIRKSTSQ